MNKDQIKGNIILCENGMQYQNLDELNVNEVAYSIEVAMNEANGAFTFESPHWIYVMRKNLRFTDGVGKWWVRAFGPSFEAFAKRGVNEGVFEYAKWSTKGFGVVCFYTSEENIEVAAKCIADAYPDLLKKNIKFKFDIDTIKGGKSKYAIQDFVNENKDLYIDDF